MNESDRFYLYEKISNWIEEIVTNSSSDELTRQYQLYYWRKKLSVLLTGSDQEILDLFDDLEYELLGRYGYSSEIKLLWDYALRIFEKMGNTVRYKGKIVTNIDDNYVRSLDLKEKAELVAKLFIHESKLKQKVKNSISSK